MTEKDFEHLTMETDVSGSYKHLDHNVSNVLKSEKYLILTSVSLLVLSIRCLSHKYVETLRGQPNLKWRELRNLFAKKYNYEAIISRV